MPTYEKVEDGRVVERSVAFLDTPLNAQLSDAAANHDSPWQLADESGEPAVATTDLVFQEPVTPDGPTPAIEPVQVDEPSEVDAPEASADTADVPDESGDHTEE